MTLRDRFEARYPCPEGVVYDESRGRYAPDIETRGIDTCSNDAFNAGIHNAMWEAYQAAMEDAPAVPEWLETVAAQLYQAAGAYNMPIEVLDNLADMSYGKKPRHTELLPITPPGRSPNE